MSKYVEAPSATMSTLGTGYNNAAFWERLWRSSGLQFAFLFLVAAFIFGWQPGIGASAETTAVFYQGDRTRILIAVFFSGLNLLNLLWFTVALRTTLADAGQEAWGAAATMASAAYGALVLLQLGVSAGLAYSIAGAGNDTLTTGLNGLSWALVVLSSFPRAMLIMAGAFGFWRARLISNETFGVGVAGVVLGVLGGSTWMQSGIWAPDGAYTRFVGPLILLLWVIGVSRVLLTRSGTSRVGW